MVLVGLETSAQQTSEALSSVEVVDKSLQQKLKSKRRLLGLVYYIGDDYKRAVFNGEVISKAEYEEMKDFVASAKREFAVLKSLLTPLETKKISDQLDRLAQMIFEKEDVALVHKFSMDIAQGLVTVFDITDSPKIKPNYNIGLAVYGEHCISCHGPQGRGDGPLAKGLNPEPPNFHDPEVIGQSSPFKAHNTLMTGIDGTAMRSFEELSQEQLWSVSFYVLGLPFSQGGILKPEQVSQFRENYPSLFVTITQQSKNMAFLAANANKILDLLKQKHPDLEGASEPLVLSLIRNYQSYQSAQTVEGEKVITQIEQTLAKLVEAKELFSFEKYKEADRLLLDAYLDHFENVEGTFALVDQSLTPKAERLFLKARNYARKGDVKFYDELGQLSLLLKEAKLTYQSYIEKQEGSDSGEFFSSLIIILREGFEAFLVIAALLALLKNLGDFQAVRWIHAGWILAIVAGALSFVVLEWVLGVSGFARESLEAISTAIAVILLFYTGFWLLSQAERDMWDSYIKKKTSMALDSKRTWSLFSVVFIAVYREAAETVLFYSALFKTAHNPSMITAGFVFGCLLLFVLCSAILKYNVRIPIKQFFQITSALMVAIAIVLVGKAVQELIEIGFLSGTPLDYIPSVPLLGIFPNLESILAQVALLVLGFLLAASIRKGKANARAVSAH